LEDQIHMNEEERFLLEVINSEIGYGIFSRKKFLKGDFLLEYKGEMITASEAESRRKVYEQENKGCYIYDGVMAPNGKAMSVDATNVFNYGKFVNDSPEKLANSSMKRKVLNGDVHLCLFAKTDIEINTEIRIKIYSL